MLSGREIFSLGEQYSTTSTINSKLVPFLARGHMVLGSLVQNDGVEKEYWFTDLSSAYGCANLGHAHPSIVEAMKKQIETGLLCMPSFDWHSETPVLLKQKLCEIAPVRGEEKVAFLCNSGAESIEAAMKMCMARRQRRGSNWPRCEWLTFSGAFHGRTLGALSLNRSKKIHRDGFDTAIQATEIPFPKAGDKESINKFNAFLDGQESFFFDHVTAVFLEIIQGEGGIRLIDTESLLRLRRKCDTYGIYFVVDEVQTGLMRTGKMFASEYYDLKPDIICMGKSLGGGLPLGAVVAGKEFDFEPGQHASTFGGNQVACAGSLALLDELAKLSKEEFSEKELALIDFGAKEGLGLMRGMVFDTPEERSLFIDRALEKAHIILLGAGTKTVRFMPPVNIPISDLNKALADLNECLLEQL